MPVSATFPIKKPYFENKQFFDHRTLTNFSFKIIKIKEIAG